MQWSQGILSTVKRLLKSFRYAFIGLRLAWAEGINFKIEVAVTVLVLILSVALHLPSIEFALVILAISGVLAIEAFNTALEELCDKFQSTHDPHIARIKDLSASAVLLTAIGALVIGLLVFVPHL